MSLLERDESELTEPFPDMNDPWDVGGELTQGKASACTDDSPEQTNGRDAHGKHAVRRWLHSREIVRQQAASPEWVARELRSVLVILSEAKDLLFAGLIARVPDRQDAAGVLDRHTC